MRKTINSHGKSTQPKPDTPEQEPASMLIYMFLI